MRKDAPYWLVVGSIDIKTVAKELAKVFALPTPEQKLGSYEWVASIPKGAAPFLDMFRRKYFEYQRHVKLLDAVFQKYHVKRVGDFGCGTATHLIELARLGYECIGVDESAESLQIGLKAAERAGVIVTLWEGDLREFRPERDLDAVVSMYVPLSLEDQISQLYNIRNFLRPGGIFVQLYARVLESAPQRDEKFDLDIAVNDRYKVVRVEHWWLERDHIGWNAFYFAKEDDADEDAEVSTVITFADHNDMRFPRSYNEKERSEFFKEIGYRLVERIPLPGSRSAPPWTEEMLEILELQG